MNDIILELNKLFEQFEMESSRFLNNNKAAGVRARKISLVIEKKLKEFRSRSVEFSKQKSNS